jgi:hypothetical protein
VYASTRFLGSYHIRPWCSIKSEISPTSNFSLPPQFVDLLTVFRWSSFPESIPDYALSEDVDLCCASPENLVRLRRSSLAICTQIVSPQVFRNTPCTSVPSSKITNSYRPKVPASTHDIDINIDRLDQLSIFVYSGYCCVIQMTPQKLNHIRFQCCRVLQGKLVRNQR